MTAVPPAATPFELRCEGRPIRGFVQPADPAPGRRGPRPAIVFCHGFKGFLEWGFFPPLAELLAARGFAVVRFDFAGSGMRPGDELVTDLAAFRDDTPSRALAELLTVLEALPALAPGEVAAGRVGLFGHSRGGGTALLAAAHPSTRDRVGALVTWSSIGTFDRFSPEERRAWRATGELPLVNTRTGQPLAMGVGFLDDVEAHREALDLEAAAARRTAPWLLVHGTGDASVPYRESERLAAAATGEHELRLVPGADHGFGAKHPFASPTRDLVTAMNATQTWYRRHLA